MLILGAAGLIAAWGFAAPSPAVAASPPAETLAPNFQDIAMLGGLAHPTVVRFAPDGRVFVAQKNGEILVYDSLTDPTPKLFADLRTEVDDYWDRGLLGLALDPGFPQRPYVYALFTYDAPIGGTAPVFNDACADPTGAGCVVSGRLVRLTASGDTATTEQTLISDQWCQQFPSHSIGTLEFGPDGDLYVSAGDGASFTYADYGQQANPCADPPSPAGTALTPPAAQGGALRAQSARRPDGEPAVLNGAILRVDPATGAAATGNPLSGDPNRRRIVAYGLRNPFRFTFRPGTGELWIGDVGWNTWEEVDRAPTPTSDAANFGWPCYEGPAPQSGYQAIGLDSCSTLASSAVTAPYYTYQHGHPLFAGDSCPTGTGSSISGLSFYTGASYPGSYDGGLFFADYSRKCIYFMPQGSNGLPDPSGVRAFVSGAAGPVNLTIGPGGDLYYVGYDDGVIHRITYAAPVAVATATPSAGSPPLTVQFDGSGSTSGVSYAWDLNGDGLYDDSTAASPSWSYTTPGVYHPRLKVTDSQGVTSLSAPLTITVSAPPVVTIDAPDPSLRWSVGEQIAFSGHATDAAGGALPASDLSWSIVLHHCPGGLTQCHTHDLQTVAGAGGNINAPDHDYPSYLEFRLTATDSAGLSSTVSRTVDPRTVELAFASRPSGALIAVDSAAESTPFSRTVIVGSTHSVSAPSTLTASHIPFAFGSWSDGGNATHNLVAPSASATYTATYNSTRTLTVSPTQLNLRAVAAHGAPPVALTVADPGPSGLTFTATTDQWWLNATPAQGSAPGIVTVRAAPTGLHPGYYSGHVTLTAPDALGSPLTIPVTLTVEPPASGAPQLRLLFGTTRIGSHPFASPALRAIAFSLAAARDGMLRSLRVYLDRRNRARDVVVALFDSRGGRPGRLLARTTLHHARAGAWNELRLRAPRLLARHRYWLALGGTDATLRIRYSNTACRALLSPRSNLRTLLRTWARATPARLCGVSVSGWG
ncbi:MAG: PQQ-dependent sugar dehydrogenase [Solirubrobacterales bacterium]|nr:PQQ-dependent sugar dehydrogenase [Solirubrobacterales bacterium]